jgi:CBS domain containing-hemolysin-like protein
MSTLTLLVLFGLCVLLQGFFSGSEIALVSADRVRLETRADQGHRGSALALRLLAQPTWALGTCLIGTNLCMISAATIGAILVSRHLGWPGAAAALCVIPITLTFGEMVPKVVYQHHANRLVGVLVFPLRAFATLLSPVLWCLERITDKMEATQGGHSPRAITREEIALLLDDVQDERLTASDKDIIRRVLEFGDATVEDAMVPLIEVVAIEQGESCAQAVRRMEESGHSRLPIYDDRIDHITGILLHQDLILEENWGRKVQELSRSPIFVPESKGVDQMLLELRRRRRRMAVAVDEYGGAVGIITVEDLVEEIVGDIEDESDPSRQLVVQTGPRSWVALGRAEREHLLEACGLVLPDGDLETLAGCMLILTGRIPRTGDHVELDKFTLTVRAASDRAILEVGIRAHR